MLLGFEFVGLGEDGFELGGCGAFEFAFEAADFGAELVLLGLGVVGFVLGAAAAIVGGDPLIDGFRVGHTLDLRGVLEGVGVLAELLWVEHGTEVLADAVRDVIISGGFWEIGGQMCQPQMGTFARDTERVADFFAVITGTSPGCSENADSVLPWNTALATRNSEPGGSEEDLTMSVKVTFVVALGLRLIAVFFAGMRETSAPSKILSVLAKNCVDRLPVAATFPLLVNCRSNRDRFADRRPRGGRIGPAKAAGAR